MSAKCDCLPLPFSTANQPLNGCHIYPLNQWATIRTTDFFLPSHHWLAIHDSNDLSVFALGTVPIQQAKITLQQHIVPCFKHISNVFLKKKPKYQSTGLRNNSMDGYLKFRQFVLEISRQTCLMMFMGLVLVCVITENTCYETKLPFCISDMFHTLRLDAVYWTLTETNFNLNPWKSSAAMALAAVTQFLLCVTVCELCKLTRVVYHRELLHWPL